jgi:glycosyltransferase involved in cell wall biosynthesis
VHITRTTGTDVLCLSHLRWNFVFQRPQHLMVRCARDRRVFFIEEPIVDASEPWVDVRATDGVQVVTPHLPAGLSDTAAIAEVRRLLSRVVDAHTIRCGMAWLYTPLMLPLVADLSPSTIVYDCMDELTGFAGASPHLKSAENELLRVAAVVFTGGHSLFRAKRDLHPNVHAFPSSVDVPHFARARRMQAEPADQSAIARPRIGFCGVIDERMDLALVRDAAAARPGWQFVMLGPVVKIDPNSVPQAANIHYLGMKAYADLPAYFSGWDVATLPFARNDATRFISPTKTPEYLAAGCPVVSTPIADVVQPYGRRGLVHIAEDADAFVAAIESALTPSGRSGVERAEALLSRMSWDSTWEAMRALVREAERRTLRVAASSAVAPALRAPAVGAAGAL